jgi:HTH-type transcriptional regulator/antitoxin HipB
MPAPATYLLLTATQLGQLLRTARKRRGLTQAQVGARLGLSQNRVSHLEGHADELSVKQLLTWCAVVGLELGVAERQSLSSPSTTVHLAPAPASTAGPRASSGAPDTPPEW